MIKRKTAICLAARLLSASLLAAFGVAAHAQSDGYHKRHDLALSVDRTDTSGVKTTFLNVGLIGGVDHSAGLQLNAMTSFAAGATRGVQVSGLSSVSNDLRGAQLSGFGNVSLSPFRGLQLSAITNISRGVDGGAQLSVLSNVSSGVMRGLQLGAYNYVDTLRGAQLGLINVSVEHRSGVQIGLVNYSRDTVSTKIGLVNLTPNTHVDMMFFGGNSSKINAAFRFLNKNSYSVIGLGTHYMGLDERFSGALYYRLGWRYRLSKRWSVSADAGYFHVETFRHNSADKPERLYSLQARANAEYRLNDRLGAFATVGYGDTRYYKGNHRYRDRIIFEGGLAVSYSRLRQRHQENRPLIDPEESEPAWEWDVYETPVGGKHPWRAALEVLGINVLVNSFDRFVLNEDFAKISLHSIKENIKTGFVWDNDQFSTNLFAHPYHGGLYFNAARSNGLGFWESAPYAVGGSLMWELACEIEPPAINDLIATSFGGVCIGEVTHRVSNLVYNDSERGGRRFLREAAGLLICPIRGFNRLLTGDAWRVRPGSAGYHDHDKLPVRLNVSAGDRYLADEGGLFRGGHNLYVDVALGYGDAFDNEDSKPYDYFTANVTFGAGDSQPLISDVHLLGKLWGVNFYDKKSMTAVFGLFQHFNYYNSEKIKDGTARVPFRISEAASIGPGLIYRFPQIGNLGDMEQRVFLNAILLGGSLSDYYNVIDRDYNMGSGYSAKIQTALNFPRFGRFSFMADYYRIYTWKGYENKDLSSLDPLHLNAQGDKGNASLLVISPSVRAYMGKHWNLDLLAAYYLRDTRYKYHDNVHSRTFEVRMGLSYGF